MRKMKAHRPKTSRRSFRVHGVEGEEEDEEEEEEEEEQVVVDDEEESSSGRPGEVEEPSSLASTTSNETLSLLPFRLDMRSGYHVVTAVLCLLCDASS